MNLGAVDLNLLVVFDAVMQERSVTRAGRRLGLSQSAMSHALARLRHMLKDELFIRSPKGMVPTPRSEELAVPIRAALYGLRHSLEPTQFDPANATRRFCIAVDIYAAVVLVQPLATHIYKIAPGVTLDFRAARTLDILDLLDRGESDMAIGPFAEPSERLSHQQLLQDTFVAVLRDGHPAACAQELSIETFAALPHLEVSSVQHATDFLDEALARRKLTRRIALHTPFLSAVGTLVTSDMVAVFPRRVAEELIRHHPLVIRPLSHSSPIIGTAMVWPRRLNSHPAHRWLRSIVGVVTKGLHPQ